MPLPGRHRRDAGPGRACRAPRCCAGRRARPSWRSAVERFRPDIVLFVFSGAGQREAQLGGSWVHPATAPSTGTSPEASAQAITTLSARGAKVVITTAAYSRTFGTRTATIDTSTATTGSVARSPPATGAPLIDLFQRTCPNGVCPKYENGVKLRPDGLHYEGAGAQVIAEWLVGQLHAQRVLSDVVQRTRATSFRRSAGHAEAPP